MTKSQIRDEISAKEGEKAKYENVKVALVEQRDKLDTQNDSLVSSVVEPITAPYMLSGDSGEDWIGKNCNDAEEKRSAIDSAVTSYESEVTTLRSEIVEAITQVETKISELQSIIDGLIRDYANAPDDEPETSTIN